MRLLRGASTGSSFRTVKSEEDEMRSRMDGVRVEFTYVGDGTERHSDFAVQVSFNDVLNILTRMPLHERAVNLHNYAYEHGYYLPRYPMPSKISHWCNILMTEVRKEGYI
jgi:hypothetical protein